MGWYWYRKSWEKCDELIQSSWRLSQVLLLFVTVLPLLLVVWQLRTKAPSPAHEAPMVAVQPVRPPTADAPLTAAGVRLQPLLPYSVIPGGARDEQELHNAIEHDPVVALHYANFNVARVHVVRLDRDEAFYVSYRLGDRVYWTSRKLLLHRGETVLSDGEHEARTRCGNRLSLVPAAPTSPREPSRAELESPRAPELAELVNPTPELPFAPPAVLPPPPAETPAGGVFIPPIVPIFWGGGSPGVPVVPVVPPPPTTEIPEPGGLALLAVGLTSVWLAARRRHLQARERAWQKE